MFLILVLALECLSCHDTVHADKFNASVHAPLECTGCHDDVTTLPHENKPKAVDCASCHPDAVDAWKTSLHVEKGAQCKDCHGSSHEIRPTAERSIPEMCSTCHAQKFVMEKAGLSAQPAVSYQDSVHGRANKNGNKKAADCVDCHDAHAVLPANNPQSGIFKFNV